MFVWEIKMRYVTIKLYCITEWNITKEMCYSKNWNVKLCMIYYPRIEKYHEIAL